MSSRRHKPLETSSTLYPHHKHQQVSPPSSTCSEFSFPTADQDSFVSRTQSLIKDHQAVPNTAFFQHQQQRHSKSSSDSKDKDHLISPQYSRINQMDSEECQILPARSTNSDSQLNNSSSENGNFPNMEEHLNKRKRARVENIVTSIRGDTTPLKIPFPCNGDDIEVSFLIKICSVFFIWSKNINMHLCPLPVYI